MIDTMEHAEEEAGREYWSEPEFPCDGCSRPMPGLSETGLCFVCEAEFAAAHQLEYWVKGLQFEAGPINVKDFTVLYFEEPIQPKPLSPFGTSMEDVLAVVEPFNRLIRKQMEQ